MTNKEIAAKLNLLGKLMALHGESPFKTKSYTNAYLSIRKLEQPVVSQEEKDLLAIPGIGKTIVAKISELKDSGTLTTLDNYLEKTPAGIVELLSLKGFGPKKVKLVWDELQVETPGELLYACNENRLVDLKGFGEKTQATLKEQLEFFFDSKGEFLYGHMEKQAMDIRLFLEEQFPDFLWEFCGAFERKMQTLASLDILTNCEEMDQVIETIAGFEGAELDDDYEIKYYQIPLQFHVAGYDEFYIEKIRLSSSDAFNEATVQLKAAESEEDIFEEAGLSFLPAVMRETSDVVAYSEEQVNNIITTQDIKGVVHCHTTYSDGLHSLEQMVDAAKAKGYSYIVVTDHSKAAFYANGLSEDRLFQQMEEIKKMDDVKEGIKIFTGIECDILYDGSMDYNSEILAGLDCVIASVHSNLKMDEEKATQRIISAIENPNVHMLGHPTGRLLLSRKGYPIDHKKIIEACAANNVAIEINANPYRLDIDWTWLDLVMKKEVKISINPDAHSMRGIDDIKYGVYAAQKGLLRRESTINAYSAEVFMQWLNS